MTSGKYQQYIKTVPFTPFLTEEERHQREAQMTKERRDILKNAVRKATTILNMRGDLDFGGVDMTLRLWKVLEAPFTIEEQGFVHNFHQYLVFASGDPDDPDNLGGEAYFSFGQEGYKYSINKNTIVHVPPGVVHCPLDFTRIDRPMLWLEIFTSSKYLRTAVYDIVGHEKKDTRVSPSRYAKHIKSSPFFTRKEIGAMKGLRSPLTRMLGIKDFSGVDLSLEMSFLNKPFTMIDKTHDHNYHQYLMFLGSDLNNPDNLGGEVTMYFGKEKEKYVINKPAIIHVAPRLVHAPLEITKVDKPIVHIAIDTSPFYARMTEYD